MERLLQQVSAQSNTLLDSKLYLWARAGGDDGTARGNRDIWKAMMTLFVRYFTPT